jgi:hypothetical protein
MITRRNHKPVLPTAQRSWLSLVEAAVQIGCSRAIIHRAPSLQDRKRPAVTRSAGRQTQTGLPRLPLLPSCVVYLDLIMCSIRCGIQILETVRPSFQHRSRINHRSRAGIIQPEGHTPNTQSAGLDTGRREQGKC